MSNGAIWKLDTHTGAWTDITPDKPSAGRKFGYAAVSVDGRDPRAVIVSSFGRPSTNGTGEDIFRSIDGGKTWKQVFGGGGTYDYSLAPYVRPTPIHWLFDIEIDPLNSDHAMFTTGYGGWETFDLTALDTGKPTHWSIMSTGIEETVGLALLSPPSKKPAEEVPLITAIGDYGGFSHEDLDKPAPEGASAPPRFGNTTGLAGAELNPDIVVRTGNLASREPGTNISYSLDGGHKWHSTASVPQLGAAAGTVAVSADGKTWVWTPERGVASVTPDRGATWTPVQGLPPTMRVIADRTNPEIFYAVDIFGGKLFESTDRAATFTVKPLNLPGNLAKPGNRGDARGGQDHLYATPGRQGDLWLAAFDGLYRGGASGAPFLKLPGVDEIHAFGFGRHAPGSDYPALLLVGTVRGQPGIFRSNDAARTWVRINDDQHQWGLVLQISGDPKQYGRVYVGTHGRGVFYGDPQ